MVSRKRRELSREDIQSEPSELWEDENFKNLGLERVQNKVAVTRLLITRNKQLDNLLRFILTRYEDGASSI